jgi:predicted enzyme related to lactoylglutathione lyase
MGRPVVHWQIDAKDPAKTQSFYGELFDWQIDANNPWSYGLVNTGGDGGINGGIGPTQDANRVVFFVQVDDLQGYLDKAERLGARTLMPPTEVPGAVTMAMFADLEGNHVGLVKG